MRKKTCLEVLELMEKGNWAWTEVVWRRKRYYYGWLRNRTPEEAKCEERLLKGEQRAMDIFWEELARDPKKLSKLGKDTYIPRFIYHPNVPPPPQQHAEKLKELIGAVLKHRNGLEQVQGCMTLTHNWVKEMENLNVPTKPSFNFLLLEKEQWITAAEYADEPNEALSKALRELTIERVERISWKKLRNGDQALTLTLKNVLFEEGVMKVLTRNPLTRHDPHTRDYPAEKETQGLFQRLEIRGEPHTGDTRKNFGGSPNTTGKNSTK